MAEGEALKIILLGDSAVGKSKLVERYLMDEYKPMQHSTYALTLFRSEEEINGVRVPVDFWDTAGQERFDSLHPSYYHRAHGCILAFDCTRKITYTNLSKWFKELQEYRRGIPCIVVANKIDLAPEATNKSFAFAAKRGMPFQFVSASDGTNVVRVFRDIIAAAHQARQNPLDDFEKDVLDLLAEDGTPV